MGEGSPKQLKAKIAGGVASSFASTHQAHARGFDAVKKAQESHHVVRAAKSFQRGGSNPVPGGGAKERARRLARMQDAAE